MKIYSKRTKWRVLSVALLIIGASVVSLNAGEIVHDTEKKAAESKQGDFVRGAKLWANNCVRCHNMRDPKDLNDREWKVATSHMRVRAGLTGQDSRDILEFLQRSN